MKGMTLLPSSNVKKNANKLACIFLFRPIRNAKVILAIFMDTTKINCLNGSHSC